MCWNVVRTGATTKREFKKLNFFNVKFLGFFIQVKRLIQHICFGGHTPFKASEKWVNVWKTICEHRNEPSARLPCIHTYCKENLSNETLSIIEYHYYLAWLLTFHLYMQNCFGFFLNQKKYKWNPLFVNVCVCHFFYTVAVCLSSSLFVNFSNHNFR